MKICVGSDHAGVKIKKAVVEYLREKGIEVEEFGPSDEREKVDYPDIAREVAQRVSRGDAERGVLICGTGIGMSITANKFPGVRAALVLNEFMAEFSARHNGANIIVFPGRVLAPHYSLRLLDIWLYSPFDGGRHERRVEKIKAIEEEIIKKLS